VGRDRGRVGRTQLIIGLTVVCLGATTAAMPLSAAATSNGTPTQFALPEAESAKFPNEFNVTNRLITHSVRTAAGKAQATTYLQPTTAINSLSPYFPPFTHFVIIYRESHTFDDYLGDCAKTVIVGCNGRVLSPNHISQVPDLHKLAKTYALDDAYRTGTQPPSGPNHWFLFSGQSSSRTQAQAYPSATGTEFDRFLGGDTVPAQGTRACSGQTTKSGSGHSPYTFVMNGDIYSTVKSGSGYWRNPKDGKAEVLPIDRPGTKIPEELNFDQYTCQHVRVSDTQVADGFLNFVKTDGLPAYSYVELFNDHPGSAQNIGLNDKETYRIVMSLMGNAKYKNNTVIIVTEDDTQNGANGSDHVSNTYRVPLVVIGSPKYVKQHYLSHVEYTTANVLAAMERVMENVKSGIINPQDAIGLSTFPMTTSDQAALGDPLEDFWVNGAAGLLASASANTATGNAPLDVNFTASASGGTAPFTYSWDFGDGTATSSIQDPSHMYTKAGTFTATVTVTDSASPAKSASASVQTMVNTVGGTLTAIASAIPTSGQIPLPVNFTGTASGGTPPYTYSWNFGDGTTSSTQDPSHTYSTAGAYTSTLIVTDSSSPGKNIQASVTITAWPVGGTVPGAPTKVTATAGSGKIALYWAAPASDGGHAITAYEVFRGTSSGTETLLTSGGCSNLGVVLTCTDTGLTNGTTYFYYVIAANPIGTGPQSNETSAKPSG
jgi:PKD repeat protein